MQATGNAVAQVERWVFTGLAAGDHIEGYAGGVKIDITYATSQTATLTALGTFLSTNVLDPFTGDPLYTVAVTGGNTVTITSNRAGTPNAISLAVTNGTGVDRCHNAKNKGIGSVAYEEVTANKRGDSPILIPYTTITQNNVLAELEKMYVAISSTNPDLLENPNAKLHVSRHVANMINLATKNVSNQIRGVQSIIDTSMIVAQPYLQGSIMFFGARENLHFGTDLISDLGSIQQWVSIDDQEVRFRAEVMQATQIDNFREIFANLENAPFEFQAPQVD